MSSTVKIEERRLQDQTIVGYICSKNGKSIFIDIGLKLISSSEEVMVMSWEGFEPINKFICTGSVITYYPLSLPLRQEDIDIIIKRRLG
jgi:hypothetical protein